MAPGCHVANSHHSTVGREHNLPRLNVRTTRTAERYRLLYTIALVLLILWALGLVTSTTMGGFIHILIVVAVVLTLVRLIRGA